MPKIESYSFCTAVTCCCTVNFSVTRRRAAYPICSALSRSDRICKIALAIAFESLQGTSKPFTPSSIMSKTPPAAVATTGLAVAIPSITVKPKGFGVDEACTTTSTWPKFVRANMILSPHAFEVPRKNFIHKFAPKGLRKNNLELFFCIQLG